MLVLLVTVEIEARWRPLVRKSGTHPDRNRHMALRPTIPASSTSSRSIRRGDSHPPGRSRTPSESAKL